MPRPPSRQLLESSSAGASSGSNPSPSSTTSIAEPVGAQLVRDRRRAAAVRAVRVAHRVRHRLGQRELQVGERARRYRAHAGETREREAAERDVFRLRRDAQRDRAGAVATRQRRGCGLVHHGHGSYFHRFTKLNLPISSPNRRTVAVAPSFATRRPAVANRRRFSVLLSQLATGTARGSFSRENAGEAAAVNDRPARAGTRARAAPPMRLGQLPGDREPEPAARRPGARRRGRTGRRPAPAARAECPGPSSSTRSSAPLRDDPHDDVPGGVCTSAFSTSARPIWSTRSSSPSATPRRPRSPARAGGRGAARRRANSSRRSSATSREVDGLALEPHRPASSRDRSSRSVASFGSRSTCSRHRLEELAPGRLVELLVRSSSRKPPSEKSGVRSSCDALAMNSRRASSSWASRSRIRSKARASWPSSSRPGRRPARRTRRRRSAPPRLQPPDPAREQQTRRRNPRQGDAPSASQARQSSRRCDGVDVLERRCSEAEKRTTSSELSGRRGLGILVRRRARTAVLDSGSIGCRAARPDRRSTSRDEARGARSRRSARSCAVGERIV